MDSEGNPIAGPSGLQPPPVTQVWAPEEWQEVVKFDVPQTNCDLAAYPPGITGEMLPPYCAELICNARFCQLPDLPVTCILATHNFSERRGQTILKKVSAQPAWEIKQEPLVVIPRCFRGFPTAAQQYLRRWLNRRYRSSLYSASDALLFIQFHVNLMFMYASYHDYRTYFALKSDSPPPPPPHAPNHATIRKHFESLGEMLSVNFKHYQHHLKECIHLLTSINHRRCDPESNINDLPHLSLNVYEFLYHTL